MILTRSIRLSQPQGPVEVAPEWGGRGAVYLPPVQSNINRVAGTVGRGPTPQGVSATYSAGVENKIERLNGSAPNGITEFTQLIYITPLAGGAVNDRGIFGSRNTVGATSFVQLVHRARDAAANGRFCYAMSHDPTSGATETVVRTSDYSAVDNVPALLVATVKNNTLSLYLDGVLHTSTAASAVAMSGQAELQIGNYYDNVNTRRLSANVHMAAFLPLGLGASEVAALSRNPWQLFRPAQRRVYFDMGAGGGVTLTGANCAQSNTSTSGAISQTHSLSGASVAQSNTSTTGAIGQSIILTGASVSQGNASTSGAVSQTHVLIGANCQQANTSTSGAVVQTGDLTGANCAQVNTSSNGSISQTHVLSGASCTQPNTTTSGAVIIVSGVILTGANCAQGNTTTTGSISQSHVLIGAPVAIDHIATASSIVQTHILSGADCSQSNYSTTGSINQVVIPSQFIASVPAGVFSASVPSEKFSAAVPGGNQ